VARSVKIYIQQTDEHDKATRQRVDEKLEGNGSAIYAAPPQADEVNRDQRHFPEDVEEKAIEGNEYADQGHFHKQDKRIEGIGIVVFVFERRKDDQGCQHGGQQDEQHADAVDAEMETD